MADDTEVAVPGTTSPAATGKRIKVLHMIRVLTDMGGAERLVVGLATSLPPDRFEAVVCSPRGGSPRAVSELQMASVTFVDLGRRGRWELIWLWRLIRLVQTGRFDVVHTHLLGSNFWGSLVARACRVPVTIAHEHTWSFTGNRLRMVLDRRVIARLATRFVAVSQADAERMVRLEHIPAEKIVVIPTAYVPHDASGPADLRAALGLEASTPLVGTACVMRPQKALEVLIEAHAHLLRSVPSAHLILIGDGESRAEHERAVQERGLTSSVHFIGARYDVDALLRELDVAAMSSDYEGEPLFVRECMANHTPLVATAVGGLPGMVEEGVTGLLVKPRDPEALADAIARLLRDREFADRIAAEAARRVAPFELSVVTQQFAALYDELLQAARASRTRRW